MGVKTAVSVPDDVFSSAERLAERMKVSRSELYSRALAEFLARHAPETVTESWDAVLADVEPNDDTTAVARHVFEQVEW
jgi:predicted transcriptional regulator